MGTKATKDTKATKPNTKESTMDTLTTLLCALFALVKQRRVTAGNLRRFVECPERLDDDWAIATAEEHLARIAETKMGQEFSDLNDASLRCMLERFERARKPSKERFQLFLAEEAFRVGVEEGVSMIQMRWFDGKDPETWENKEDVGRIRVSEEWRHNYADLLAIMRRGLAGTRVSPYEFLIKFENCFSYSAHLIRAAGVMDYFEYDERLKHLGRRFSNMEDDEMRQVVKDYWQPYLEHARKVVTALDWWDQGVAKTQAAAEAHEAVERFRKLSGLDKLDEELV